MKLEDDEIHKFTEEMLQAYIKMKILDIPSSNKKFSTLRKIFCIYKHPHLLYNALKIKEIYIPIYS